MVKESSTSEGAMDGIHEEEKKETQHPTRARYSQVPYQLFEHVDCLDSHNHWLNGEII